MKEFKNQDIEQTAITLKMAKDQIAKKYGYSDWAEVNFYAIDAMAETTSAPYAEQALQDEASELYASLRTKKLQERIKELERWKKEYFELWNPIDEYVRPETKLGESVSGKTLELLKDRQQARNEAIHECIEIAWKHESIPVARELERLKR